MPSTRRESSLGFESGEVYDLHINTKVMGLWITFGVNDDKYEYIVEPLLTKQATGRSKDEMLLSHLEYSRVLSHLQKPTHNMILRERDEEDCIEGYFLYPNTRDANSICEDIRKKIHNLKAFCGGIQEVN